MDGVVMGCLCGYVSVLCNQILDTSQDAKVDL